MNKIDLLGKSFGRLLVISEEKIRDKHGNIRWACKCICGKLVSVIGPSLTKGNTKSCGCFSSDTSVKTHTKHGKSKRSGKSLEYITWDGMIQRCTNPQSSKYRFYGSIGISVCEGWLNFANFLNDMGNRPSKDYTIDRIDFNGNYEPSNCRWSTKYEQSRNKRSNVYIEYNGRNMILTDWANSFKSASSIIKRSLKRGKSFDDIYKFYENKNK